MVIIVYFSNGRYLKLATYYWGNAFKRESQNYTYSKMFKKHVIKSMYDMT